ncbi:anti-sigma factor [Deminuibacter soli]|uniref:Uncharacterized protein n=1 Tax=Deminuibacter soli TaxID=2291815 RepID=A0A3E1NPL2_9BACT|nr:hypothetical protein [Deminuibacter soli]RFM29875.1 hypothetical protein DXN05_02555 [Deminuibacter soli]
MNINRQNYEQWFLLYVDSELTLHQRMEVEIFAQQHPDLAAELESLQQAILPTGDDYTFDASFLKIQPGGKLDISNYEEQFLLYVDNELNEAGKQAVEQFAAQHPVYARKLEQLQQAVLPEEVIACPRKSALYKGSGKIIPLYIGRFAAAAALLGIIALTWQFMGKQQHSSDPVVAVTRTNTAQQQPAGQQPATSSTTGATQQTPAMAATHTGSIREPKQQEMARVNQPRTSPAQQSAQPVTTGPPTAANMGNATEPARTPLLADASIAGTAGNVSTQTLNTTLPAVSEKAVTPAATTAAVTASNDAPYQELNTNEEERGIYIGSLDINKNKLRGFFKKAGRIFSAKAKNAADEDGQLNLANMKINTRQ